MGLNVHHKVTLNFRFLCSSGVVFGNVFLSRRQSPLMSWLHDWRLKIPIHFFFVMSFYCRTSFFFCFRASSERETRAAKKKTLIVNCISHDASHNFPSTSGQRLNVEKREMGERKIGAFNYQFYANNYAKFSTDFFLLTIDSRCAFPFRCRFSRLSFENKLFSRRRFQACWGLLNSASARKSEVLLFGEEMRAFLLCSLRSSKKRGVDTKVEL